ncbi:MAG: bifunctional nuclease family protein [Roseivirga sp.]
MEKIELNLVAITNSESHPGNFAMVLEDLEAKKRIPIIIGEKEAQAIAVVLEKMKPLRPQTHDLFSDTINALSAKLTEVVINNVEDGKYHAILVLEQSGQQIEVDARTSDAIAMAVRHQCPIYSFKSILDSAGFTTDTNGHNLDRRNAYLDYSREELEGLLKKVLLKEDYESAKRIQEAITKKKG